jgi:hypothetical protein
MIADVGTERKISDVPTSHLSYVDGGPPSVYTSIAFYTVDGRGRRKLGCSGVTWQHGRRADHIHRIMKHADNV